MSPTGRRPVSLRFVAFSRSVLCLLFAALLLLPARPAQARFWARKISGVLPAGASIEALIPDFRQVISPDSQRVVYLVHGDPAGSDDLYSVPIQGGTPERLTLPGYNGRTIYEVQISPDSSRVVYTADAYTNEKKELFSVPIDGGSNPVRISSSGMTPAGDVNFYFSISPGSDRVVYTADQEVDGQENIYSVPIGGGTVTRINHDLAASVDVYYHKLTPDGERVVFRVHNEDTNLDQLFFTPIAEQNVRRLHGGPAAGVPIWYTTVLPDSSGAVYGAMQESSTSMDVYRADFYSGPAQPPPERLTNAPDPSHINSDLQVTSDGQYAVFAAYYTADYDLEYWRARTHPTGSNDVARLHPALGDERSANLGILLTPNGQGAIFGITENATGKNYLYSNTIASPLPAPYQLSHTPPGNNTGVSSFFAITPNSLGVVFVSDAEEAEVIRLYSNWITGGSPISLTPYLAAGGDVANYLITPDSLGVVFRADGLTNNQDELFIVPTVGPWTAARRLNSPMANPNGDVVSFRISPDGSKVTYIADADTDEKFELYVVEDVELQFLPLASR